jgi:hypothetical protein
MLNTWNLVGTKEQKSFKKKKSGDQDQHILVDIQSLSRFEIFLWIRTSL